MRGRPTPRQERTLRAPFHESKQVAKVLAVKGYEQDVEQQLDECTQIEYKRNTSRSPRDKRVKGKEMRCSRAHDHSVRRPRRPLGGTSLRKKGLADASFRDYRYRP